jgi:hypothetical protein
MKSSVSANLPFSSRLVELGGRAAIFVSFELSNRRHLCKSFQSCRAFGRRPMLTLDMLNYGRWQARLVRRPDSAYR